MSLNEEFGKTIAATHSDIPMAEHHPKNDSFEEVKFISPFVSLNLSCETECPSPPSLEHKTCPSGHPNVVLDDGQDSTLIVHDVSFKKVNICATDMLLSTHAPLRTTTTHCLLSPNFLEGWLWMHMFIIDIANLMDALWY